MKKSLLVVALCVFSTGCVAGSLQNAELMLKDVEVMVSDIKEDIAESGANPRLVSLAENSEKAVAGISEALSDIRAVHEEQGEMAKTVKVVADGVSNIPGPVGDVGTMISAVLGLLGVGATGGAVVNGRRVAKATTEKIEAVLADPAVILERIKKKKIFCIKFN